MARPNESSRPVQPDPQWLERMYLNRLRVPGHAALLARWQAESAQARQQLPGPRNEAYGPGPQERLDAFAAPAKGAPLLIIMPGGEGIGPLRWPGRTQGAWLAAAAHALGAAAVVPDVDACPRASLPHVSLQLTRAVAWAWRNARSLRADPRRIVVLGHGLGAQAAAMMLNCAWPLVDAAMPRHAVTRGMGLSGLYDLEPLMLTPSLQEVLRLDPQQVQQASPARMPAPARGSFYCLAGAEESGEHLRQNQLLRRHWGRRCVPVATAVAGLNHFSLLQAVATPGHRPCALLRRLLAS